MMDESISDVAVDTIVIPGPRRPIHALLYTPRLVPGPFDLALIAHGGGGLGAKEDVAPVAARLTRNLGIAALAIDAPGHGADLRQPTDRLAQFRVMRRRLNAADFAGEWAADWRACVDELSRTARVTPRLAYVGSSMSSIVGTSVMAALPPLDAAVLTIGGIGDIDQMVAALQQLVGHLIGPEAPAILAEEENLQHRKDLMLEDAAKIESTPVLMINGTSDPLVSPEGALTLFDALATRDKRLIFFPAGHEVPPDGWDAVIEFVRGHLGPRDCLPDGTSGTTPVGVTPTAAVRQKGMSQP